MHTNTLNVEYTIANYTEIIGGEILNYNIRYI